MTENGLIVPALVVIVGQACSLKCKHCANFSPYTPKETKHYPLKQIMDNLELLFHSAYHIRRIQVQGGEPFLYAELAELLDFIRNSNQVTTLTVATNGTVLPKEPVLLALKRNQVRVRISKYAAALKEQVLLLKKRLDELEIENWLYEFASEDSMWYDMGQESDPYPGEVQKRFLNCPFHDCYTLENGRIGRCSRAVIAEQVQGFTAQENDLLYVKPSEDFPIRLWEYLKTQSYMEACRYCLGPEGKKVVPAQQLL